MKILKNRTVLGILCILISLVVGFVAVPMVNQVTSSTKPVVRATTAIKKGAAIDPGQLTVVEIDAASAPAGALGEIAEVAGRYAAVDITPGDTITVPKISEVEAITDGYLYTIPTDKLAMSVTVKSFAGGLSGKLRAGDIVSVFVTVEENMAEQYEPSPDITPGTLPPELKYVEVLAVSDDRGGEVTAAADQLEEDEEAALPATVTLLVSERQAAILAGLERNRAHIAFVTRDRGEAEVYLSAQEEYLLRLDEEEEEPDEEADHDTVWDETEMEGEAPVDADGAAALQEGGGEQ